MGKDFIRKLMTNMVVHLTHSSVRIKLDAHLFIYFCNAHVLHFLTSPVSTKLRVFFSFFYFSFPSVSNLIWK